jgi:hypothetical protein
MDKQGYELGRWLLDLDSGVRLSSEGIVYAGLPYTYSLSGSMSADPAACFSDNELTGREIIASDNGYIVKGLFTGSRIELIQRFYADGEDLCESITLTNKCDKRIDLDTVRFGFTADMHANKDWRLCAVPLRIQLDGSVHDHTAEMLEAGEYKNAVHPVLFDKYLPELTEKGILRSEAWAWGDSQGILIIKYSAANVELSIARPDKKGDLPTLEFGGAGFCLYHEPFAAGKLEAGESYTFAPTVYMHYDGGRDNAFYAYRSFIENKGHGFPEDYDPPVNWNVLYDVGWHHSDADGLKKNYTKEALLEQAGYAKKCGCELLYLDPGWETAEGLTVWDEDRLGTVSDLIRILKEDYGMGLGYRTILFAHHKHDLDKLWPPEYKVQLFRDRETEDAMDPDRKYLRGLCMVNDEYLKEKLKRILDISVHGIKFMMFDEMEWCGTCFSDKHSHSRPTEPLDHIRAVYGLVGKVKKECPGMTAEVHDPVWPWLGCNYLPTYFGQSRYTDRGYDEKWGFEFMWDCINDLKTGKALSLYYYNLGSSVPLYLHITMAADNDNCLFLWWAASTVRHLGIGGRNGHKTVNPQDLPAYDKDKRYMSYVEQMKVYKRLKPYFARGEFTGISECIHLHTLAGSKGGVVNLFNLTDDPKAFDFIVPADKTGKGRMNVQGAAAEWTDKGLRIRTELPPMAPGSVFIGDACE